MGKSAEAIRIGRTDLGGDPGIERAGVGDACGAGQVLSAGRQGRPGLEVDAGRIQVGDAARADVDVEPGRAWRDLDAIEPAQLSRRDMLFQPEQEPVLFLACGCAAGQGQCRCGGETERGRPG